MPSVTANSFNAATPRAANLKFALVLTYITLGWMTIEGAGALLLGWASKSLLLEAFGIDSLIELFSWRSVAVAIESRGEWRGNFGARRGGRAPRGEMGRLLAICSRCVCRIQFRLRIIR